MMSKLYAHISSQIIKRVDKSRKVYARNWYISVGLCWYWYFTRVYDQKLCTHTHILKPPPSALQIATLLFCIISINSDNKDTHTQTPSFPHPQKINIPHKTRAINDIVPNMRTQHVCARVCLCVCVWTQRRYRRKYIYILPAIFALWWYFWCNALSEKNLPPNPPFPRSLLLL